MMNNRSKGNIRMKNEARSGAKAGGVGGGVDVYGVKQSKGYHSKINPFPT